MDENNQTKNDLDKKIEDFEHEKESKFDYDFLKESEPAKSEEDLVTNQFDIAFKKSSPVIQDYILGNKLEENIALISKIEKLDDEKSRTIIENITVSLLVGLLPISEAKDTLIESFRSSGILIEPLAAGMVLKNIDAYILSDIRKKILENKIDSAPTEIRHLTLKEQNEEKEKEELRKILLERTGNINGKGKILVQYKNREPEKKQSQKDENVSTGKEVFDRESLLQKINMQNISDSEKIKDRMQQIKKDEDERLKREKNKEKKDEELKENRRQKEDKEISSQHTDRGTDLPENSEVDVSEKFAEVLKGKLDANEDKNTDLDTLRQKRGEIEKVQVADTTYSRMLNNAKESKEEESDVAENFDPYRESI